jgi:acyl carrier protein
MSVDRHERRQDLLRFLRTIQKPHLSIGDLGDDEGLVTVGLIDSLALLQIVTYLEDTYGIDFSVLGVDAEKLGTIGGILDLIDEQSK